MLSIGTTAPDFTLYNTQKEQVSLSSFKGKNVILLFFPLAFSSVCTAELCNVRDNLSIYNDLQAEVFGVSVDSLFSLEKFKTEQGLNFQLLSDFNKAVSKAYECLYDIFPAFDMLGVSKRSGFVIDKEGVVRYAQVNEKPQDPTDFAAIQQTLKQLN